MKSISLKSRLPAFFVIASAVSILTACGGGGGGGSADAASNTETAFATTLGTAVAGLNMKSTLSDPSQVGAPYSQTNVASGGTLPYAYSLALGTLPPGVTLDATTGAVSGTPTTAGSFQYSIRVTDGARTTRRNDLTITVAEAAPAATSTPAPVTPVQSEDVLYNFSASNLESYKYATLQCQGTNRYSWQWGGQYGYYTNPLPNPIYGTYEGAPFAAFSTEPSPDEPGKSAFKWDVRMTDPDTAGTNSKRCEFTFGWNEYTYPGKVLSRQMGLPANQDFWWSVAIRQEDWSSTASTNDWQILWQWHDRWGGDLPPFLSLQAKGNLWQVMLAYDMNTSPSNSTLRKVTPWTGSISPNAWHRFVVKARKDLVNPANAYVQVWLNGTQIVNYHGPFGYNVTPQDYAKVGIYKWISSSNVWNAAMPARRSWTKGPVQVNDRAGYTWESIDALMD